MSSSQDFVIEQSVLVEYKGSGGAVVIPDGVTRIGSRAFKCCSGLESIIIPEGVTEIGRSAFFRCSNLASVIIPGTVTEIEPGAFSMCSSLASVIIPGKVTNLGSNAFSFCSSLTSVTFPENLKIIEACAFEYCKSLTSIKLPEGLIGIESGAFRSCQSLTSIEIPKGVSRIEDKVFLNCDSLKSVKLPNGLSEISASAFYSCESLTSIAIPESVTTIGEYAFYACSKLASISIPKQVKTIHAGTFEKCSRLTRVNLPEGLGEIGNNAFAYCKQLTTITLPEGVTKIGDEVFVGCSKLSELVIPDSVSSLGKSALNHSNAPSVHFNHEFKTTKKLPSFIMDYSASNKLTTDDMAHVLSYQYTKGWIEWLQENDKAPSITLKKALELLKISHKKVPKTILKQIRDYMLSKADMVDTKVYSTALEFIQHNDDLIAKELADNDKTKVKLGTQEEHQIEAFVRSLDIKPDKDVAALVKKGIPYSDRSGTSSREAVIAAISLYAEKYFECASNIDGGKLKDLMHPYKYKKIRPIQDADRIVASLNWMEFSNLIISQRDTPKYRSFLFAMARFCTESQVIELIEDVNKRNKGSMKDRQWAKNVGESLLLSDTAAAAMFFDEKNDLARYSELRGFFKDDYRDTYLLPEFPFSKDGVIRFDGGDYSIELSVTADLTLRLLNLKTQKEIKKFPATGKDAQNQKEDESSYEAIRESLLQFIANRRLVMERLYLEGGSLSESLFHGKYLTHPVIKQFSRSLLWNDQKNNTFAISQDFKAVSLDGSPYQTQGRIRLAHVVEMDPEEVKKWQEYLVRNRMKQLFPQMWEPAIRPTSSRFAIKDRYQHVEVTHTERNEFKRRMQERAIEVKSDEMHKQYDARSNTYVFDNNSKLRIGDNVSIQYSYDPDKKTTTLGELSYYQTRFWRELNTTLFELDRLSLRAAIKQDNETILSSEMLETLTLLQLNELIQHAAKNKSVKCTAMLLNHKNKHFLGLEMDEFTLDDGPRPPTKAGRAAAPAMSIKHLQLALGKNTNNSAWQSGQWLSELPNNKFSGLSKEDPIVDDIFLSQPDWEKRLTAPLEKGKVVTTVILALTGRDGRTAANEALQPGEAVTLVREPSNPYDSNAVEVFNTAGTSLGYLPGFLAAQLAPRMDAGSFQLLSAKVTEVVPLSQLSSRAKNPKVTIEVVYQV